MDITIIIVNFNTKQLTLECIESVYNQTSEHTFEVILWDNASRDGSGDAFLNIENQYPNLQIKLSDSNHGFAKANNLAAENASGRYILLLNPDTKVLDSAIDKLVNFADSQSSKQITGGSTFFGNGNRNTTSCWNKPTVWSMFTMGSGFASIFRKSRFFNPESYAWWDWGNDRLVDIITGCFLLIPRDVWTTLNGFDLDFFMYGEDADLCLRANNLGVPSRVYPQSSIIHYEGASETVRADKMIRLFRAKDLLLEKHYSKAVEVYGKWMLNFYAFSRMLASAIVGILSGTYREKAATWKEVFIARCKK